MVITRKQCVDSTLQFTVRNYRNDYSLWLLGSLQY